MTPQLESFRLRLLEQKELFNESICQRRYIYVSFPLIVDLGSHHTWFIKFISTIEYQLFRIPAISIKQNGCLKLLNASSLSPCPTKILPLLTLVENKFYKFHIVTNLTYFANSPQANTSWLPILRGSDAFSAAEENETGEERQREKIEKTLKEWYSKERTMTNTKHQASSISIEQQERKKIKWRDIASIRARRKQKQWPSNHDGIPENSGRIRSLDSCRRQSGTRFWEMLMCRSYNRHTRRAKEELPGMVVKKYGSRLKG